jgi:hypothetical protein
MNINSLLPQEAQANQNAAAIALERKWEKTGLLEGMSDEIERKGMAVLLENQAKQLVSEANSTGTAGSQEEWAGVALPLVRRIFAEIAAKDFVSVQPMNLPSGLVFYLDFKYGTKQQSGATANGNDFLTAAGHTSQNDSVFGVTDDSKGGTVATEGLYGPGRFGYSINDVTSSALTLDTDDTLAAGEFTTGSVDIVDVNFNSEWLASSASTATKVTIKSSDLPLFDANGVRAFNIQSADITNVYPEFTKLNAAGTELSFIVDHDGNGTGAATVYYHKQPNDTNRGDFEDSNAINSNSADGGTTLDIPEINLEMRSEAIVAKTRKLKAVWSPEFAQDLNAYHSIDAEAELTSMLSEYVSQEIDLEILSMLQENAQTVERWSAKIGFEYDAATTGFQQGKKVKKSQKLIHHHLMKRLQNVKQSKALMSL